MSQVYVNGSSEPVEGRFEFSVSVDESKKPPIFSVEGNFVSASGYFEDITELRNERYLLKRVHVESEFYASETDEIVYHFTAGMYRISNRMLGGANKNSG